MARRPNQWNDPPGVTCAATVIVIHGAVFLFAGMAQANDGVPCASLASFVF
jgi:hypothetical protein